jgi:hypothetical protein
MYTLYIFDSSRSVTDIPAAGILGNFNGYLFGMYEPQSYTPLPSTHPLVTILIAANVCVICSDARRVLPKGIWWSLGLGVAAALGGLRVVAG